MHLPPRSGTLLVQKYVHQIISHALREDTIPATTQQSTKSLRDLLLPAPITQGCKLKSAEGKESVQSHTWSQDRGPGLPTLVSTLLLSRLASSGNTALRNEPQGFSPPDTRVLVMFQPDSSPRERRLLSESHHPLLPGTKICQKLTRWYHYLTSNPSTLPLKVIK